MKNFVNIYTGEKTNFVKSDKGFAVKSRRGRWATLKMLKSVSFECCLYEYMDDKGGVLLGVFSDGCAGSLAYSECVQSLETGEIFMVLNR